MDATKTNWKVIDLVAGVVLLVGVGVIAFIVTRRADPGFRLSHEEVRPGSGTWLMTSYWRITNTSDRPLIIKRVVYNGESDAEPVWEPKTAQERMEQNRSFIHGLQRWANGVPEPPPPPTPTFPVRLTVGESVKVLEWNRGRGGYEKQVVFIDVHTDRGRFRYRPASRRFE